MLRPQDFYRGNIKLAKGAVVVLSACSVGYTLPGPCHELHGLLRALFYAGAATVLGARWPILFEAADAIFGGTINLVFGNHISFAAAMNQTLNDAASRWDTWQLMPDADAAIFYWGPFALFGSGD